MRAVPLAAAAAALLLAAPAYGQAERPVYRVIVFGDSYGSGEGAPGTAGQYRSDGTGGGSPRADWSGTATDEAFTGDPETGLRGARRCHRSPRATAPKAVRLLQQRFPEVNFQFRSFACSGARIDVGVLEPYKGAEETDGTVPDDDDPPVPAQIAQANDYLGALTTARRVDALVMNIGGNNLGFADIIQKCTELPVGSDPCSPAAVSSSGGSDDAKRIFETGQGATEHADSIGLDDLPDHYIALDAAIDRRAASGPLLRFRPRDVVLTGAPNVLAGDFGGCAGLRGPFDYENRLRQDERTWLTTDIVPRLAAAMDTAAEDHGWDFVDMRAAFANGICASSGRAINRNRDVLPTQGATVNASAGINISHGWVHPNNAGFAAMATPLADQLQTRLIARFTPPRPTALAPVDVLDLGSRVEMRYTPAKADFPARPFARHTAAGSQQIVGFRGQTRFEVPVVLGQPTGAISARACGPVGSDANGPRGCSAAGLSTPVLIGTPGVPNLVAAVRDPAGVRLRWEPSAGAPPLRRFVVEAFPEQDDSIDPLEVFTGSGETTTEPSLPGGEGPLGNQLEPQPDPELPPARFSFGPAVREAVVPLGARFRVRECTDRGCGAGSNQRSAPEGIDGTDLEIDRPFLADQIGDIPIGMVSARVRERVRRGRTFDLVLGWTAWRGWKDLRDLDVRLADRNGTLARMRLDPLTGRLTLRGRDGRRRRGHTGGRKVLRSGPVRLDARRAAGLRVPSTAAFRLPLKLARSQARGSVEVAIGARARRGRRQAPRPVARFEVR